MKTPDNNLSEKLINFKNLDSYQKQVIALKFINSVCNNLDNYDSLEDSLKNFYLDFNYLINKFDAKIIKYSKEKIYYVMETYESALIQYNSILKQYYYLAETLKLNNSLELCTYMSYLLWNGYFSINKKNTYQSKNRLNLSGAYGLDCVNGIGVCLNYSSLLNDFFKNSKIQSTVLLCKLGKEITCDYRPRLMRNINQNEISMKLFNLFSIILSPIINRIGDHAVNLIKEDNKLYIYDITNLTILNVKNKDVAELVNGTGKYLLKPELSLKLLNDFDKFEMFLNLDEQKYYQDAYSRKEFIFLYERIIELLNNNKNLLNDCYSSIHSNLESISLNMKKTYNYEKVFTRK